MDRTGLYLPASVEFTEEELQQQQNRRDFFYQLAERIRDAYRDNPMLDIPHIVEQIEEAEYQDVVFVLNEFGVDDSGTVSHVGQGQGGNWIPEEVRVSLVSEVGGDPKEIGYRWPDSSLREDPFDIGNEEHRTEMGIQMPVVEPVDA